MKACIKIPRDQLSPLSRWGIAGHGDVVARRVAPAIKSCGSARLSAIWGRSLASAQMAAEKFGAAFATDDINAFLDCVDAVYIATPVAMHLPLAVRAIGLGLPVLIEKPLCAGLGNLGAFTRAAHQARAPVGVAYYRRLAPTFQWLAQKAACSAFGRFRRAEITFASPFDPSAHHPKAWRLERELAGGGVLADAGSHRLDLLCALFGFPVTITSRMEHFTRGDCERRVELELRWRDGAEALLNLSWDQSTCDRFALTFEDAEIVLDPLDRAQIECRRGGDVVIATFDAPKNPHAPLIVDFELALRGCCAPICSIAAGLAVDALIVAAREASDKGSIVALPEDTGIETLAHFIMCRQTAELT